MSHSVSLVAVFLLVTLGQVHGQCQVLGTGCSSNFPCCTGLKCDISFQVWGFCIANKTGPTTSTTSTTTGRPTTTIKGATTVKTTTAAVAVYRGDGTYYDIGVGACGWTNVDDDLVAAVSQTVYGSQANPNNSPVCGKCALIKYGTQSVKVTIVDKCMGCQTPDIDMSPAAFRQIADQSLGRIQVTWSFVTC